MKEMGYLRVVAGKMMVTVDKGGSDIYWGGRRMKSDKEYVAAVQVSLAVLSRNIRKQDLQ